MRKKDEEVIKKVVDKIIDSKVLLTGDGDFFVETIRNGISRITIRNLFSEESSIDEIQINISGSRLCYETNVYQEVVKVLPEFYRFELHKKLEPGVYTQILFNKGGSDLAKSPSFKRLVEYIEENKHLILHNDKEYGRSHTLTDADFI